VPRPSAGHEMKFTLHPAKTGPFRKDDIVKND